MASRFGRMFRVRRNDLRLLVGCGAAAAIAGAFNAPLTGAFYAFELVIGTYSLGTFAPVAVAAIVAVSVVNALGAAPFDLILQVPTRVEALDYIPILALGMVCALVGIAIMRGRDADRGRCSAGAVPRSGSARCAADSPSARWR